MTGTTTQSPLPRTDYAVRLFNPLAQSRLDFAGVRQAITADLEAEAESARQTDRSERAEALVRFAREQAARPSGPGTWEGVIADADRARRLVEDGPPKRCPGAGPVVAQGLVVDLYVCTRDPGAHVGPGGVMAFISPVRVSRNTWYDALDAARARAGGRSTPAPTVLFACGTVRRCEGATDLVPVEGQPGRFDVTQTKLIPVEG